MGEEIQQLRFEEQDFLNFKDRLADETERLGRWLAQDQLDNNTTRCGFELEAWIVDEQLRPAPVNDEFIKKLNNKMVSPELANFNIEFNFTPHDLTGDALSKFQAQLTQFWQQAEETAQELACHIVMIGILPTVRNEDLCTENISSLNRYKAINDQILRLRNGRPLELNIHGVDTLKSSHQDVMLESVTTSFQIHIQVPIDRAVRAYNASIICSAPLVAIAANSPYLLGKDLWAETRIPVFEQSVEAGGYEDGGHGPMRRVTFGSGYARESIMECFVENLDHYPILLPIQFDANPDELQHLRLHNGTLWRWNRPLVSVDPGDKHIRIEHRVIPSGPSILDTCANAALFYGLMQKLTYQDVAPENQLPFEVARDNFYCAAERGIDCHITWLDGKKYRIQSLLLDIIIPMARSGLEQLGIDSVDIDKYIEIIHARAKSGCNGAAWQRAFVAKHGKDPIALSKAYLEHQNSGLAVHQWEI